MTGQQFKALELALEDIYKAASVMQQDMTALEKRQKVFEYAAKDGADVRDLALAAWDAMVKEWESIICD